MKILAALLLLVATPALAQTPPAPEAPPAPKAPAEAAHGGPEKSARFRLQVGHIYLGLTCPDDESLAACEQFAMHLLDKAEAMQKH
jgi:hypothetical protein